MASETNNSGPASAIQHRIDLDFEFTSLDNVLRYIHEVKPGLNLVVDPSLPAQGIDLTTRTITLRQTAVTVGDTLERILKPDLGFVVRDGHTYVTTIQEVQNSLTLETYPLLSPELQQGVELNWLVSAIQRIVNNASDRYVSPWTDEGGLASVEYVNGVLLAYQTPHAQGRIHALLQELCTNGALDPRWDHVSDGSGAGGVADVASEPGPGLGTAQQTPSQEVFIVHGHDDGAKETVYALLKDLHVEPVVLHRKEDKGRTIIEKLVQVGNRAGFAVVIFTPDDLGIAKDQVDASLDLRAQLKPRARQNVLLELGYFLARIGRGNVCALLKENVEIPSDFAGVLCTQMDAAGAWRLKLATELREAGINVDLDGLKP